jgi:hypothetical protein
MNRVIAKPKSHHGDTEKCGRSGRQGITAKARKILGWSDCKPSLIPPVSSFPLCFKDFGF